MDPSGLDTGKPGVLYYCTTIWHKRQKQNLQSFCGERQPKRVRLARKAKRMFIDAAGGLKTLDPWEIGAASTATDLKRKRLHAVFLNCPALNN